MALQAELSSTNHNFLDRMIRCSKNSRTAAALTPSSTAPSLSCRHHNTHAGVMRVSKRSRGRDQYPPGRRQNSTGNHIAAGKYFPRVNRPSSPDGGTGASMVIGSLTKHRIKLFTCGLGSLLPTVRSCQ